MIRRVKVIESRIGRPESSFGNKGGDVGPGTAMRRVENSWKAVATKGDSPVHEHDVEQGKQSSVPRMWCVKTAESTANPKYNPRPIANK